MSPASGTFRYVAELVKALNQGGGPHEIVVLTASETEAALRAVVGPPRTVDFLNSGSDGSLREQLSCTRRCVRNVRPDVLHSPAYFVPARTGARVVVSVHDVNFVARFRDWARTGHALRSARLAGHVAELMLTSSAIIVPSHQTRRLLGRLLPPLAGKAHVIPYAATAATCAARSFSERSPLLLSVGVIAPQKNLATAIQAFARALSSLPTDATYQLVGRDEAGYWPKTLGPLVSALGLEERVHFAGQLDDDELERQYCLARALVFVSRGEGFGLPAVEAQARGVPVIGSSTTAIGESTGGVAMLVDPDATSTIASCMTTLMNDENYWTALSVAGVLQARRRSWADVASDHLQVYEAVGAA